MTCECGHRDSNHSQGKGVCCAFGCQCEKYVSKFDKVIEKVLTQPEKKL